MMLFSCSVTSDSLHPHGLRHTALHHLPQFAQTHVRRGGDAIQKSCPLSSPSPAFNLSQHQSLPVSQIFTSGGQSIGVSASASVLLKNIQRWFPSGWTGWIYLQSKGFSRVFSNTTIQKHQFFVSQPSLWSSYHIHTWPLEKPNSDFTNPHLQSNVWAF